MTYWDPLPTLRAAVGGPMPQDWAPVGPLLGDWSGAAPGGWERRDWRTVPGPVYSSETDTCWTGRGCAPDNVLYEDAYGAEIVYRQPRTPAEVYAVIHAAECDPFGGYGGDGDLHWSPELVREWWSGRGRVREWAVGAGRGPWARSGRPEERDAAAGARAYAAYVDSGLGEYLRGYLFRLLEGRPALAGERLPELGRG
ncbi:ferredoxin [Streptomyces sp. NBC_00249]|uniref:ferredoxin n=1 Tax=Streptomyces sp. NBC_00249 TaxID=2975690 RepID=UPI0022591824|nr:ferredoxin [Streptomyces sp. NBC_00249]MCX5196845.1 ferredoxin [Streptomyces sp. NBC_00249]